MAIVGLFIDSTQCIAYILLCLFFLVFIAIISIHKRLNKVGVKVPKIKDAEKSILAAPASVLVEKLRDGSINSERIVGAYIARIKEVNSLINAVVEDRFDAALEEARLLDRELENLPRDQREALFESKILLGIPFTCKEAFQVTGFRQTSGLVRRKNDVSNENSLVVQRMLDAGAILLGTTNVSELCMWWESNNVVYGRSKNPYNTECTVGGSSGGEGAILVAAGSVIGIGSDIGGSIRIPAFFNGVFGHKPSPGLVPNSGQFPCTTTCIGDLMLVTGPLCRYASDLQLMLKVMSAESKLLKLKADVDISTLNFYTLTEKHTWLVSKVCPELINIQEKVCQCLSEKYKASINKFERQLLEDSAKIWFTMMSMAGDETFGQTLLGHSRGIIPFWEILKWCIGRSSHTFPALALVLAEMLDKFMPKSWKEEALKCAETLRLGVEDVLGSNGVLLFPSHPTPALRHNVPVFMPYNFLYTAIFNALHMPVTQCPLGLGSNGLPLGIQVVASRSNDHLTLAVAKALEKEFGGWVQP